MLVSKSWTADDLWKMRRVPTGSKTITARCHGNGGAAAALEHTRAIAFESLLFIALTEFSTPLRWWQDIKEKCVERVVYVCLRTHGVSPCEAFVCTSPSQHCCVWHYRYGGKSPEKLVH